MESPILHLNDLFLSGELETHFKFLSEIIHFNLSIYSEHGRLIFSTDDYISLCKSLRASPDFKIICDTYCHDTKMSSIKKNKPIIFKCLAKTMGFSIPIEYMAERAVIVGQGSFSTYDDFLALAKLLSLSKVEDFPAKGPLEFTSLKQTRNACRFVNSSVNQLLKNIQENIGLKKKIDKFTTISEFTSKIASVVNHENLFQVILSKATELLKAEQGSLMILDKGAEVLHLEAMKAVAEGVTEKLRIQKGEGIAGKVVELGEPFLVEDIENDPRIMQKNRLRYKTKSFVSIPLKIADRIIGVLNISDKIEGQVFDEEDLKLIQSFATQAAVVIERDMFYKQTEEFKKLSITDPLTGLLNRRYLLGRLEEEMSRSERHGRPLSLLMLDIDGFKNYNDTFGHPMGDRALKTMGETILKSVRSIDIVSRYGGDEFMIILPETDKTVAVGIAERLRDDIAETEILPSVSQQPWRFMASIGIACYPQNGKTSELILENVDRALYNAKKKGKNRVEVVS